MRVLFIYGPAASGKHTIGTQVAALTGLPLFHNHLAVDAAKSLFAFGTAEFKNLRAAVWRAAFREAAAVRHSFVFTFHPEATVDPSLIEELVEVVQSGGGKVHFVELTCSTDTVLRRLAEPSRMKFEKLTDPVLYQELDRQGAFDFPPLPPPLLKIDTEVMAPNAAAQEIVKAVRSADNTA